jgi:teichuronic acid biosynthesis glycosyltransferase TuaG
VPRVSVIVPAYNAERYLPETLASVEAQTYDDWEVIVSDDASTDGTPHAVAAFGGRVKLVSASSNSGIGSARNLAIKASKGELLAFLDADDLWLPDYLERQVALYDDSARVADDVGIVACDARILGPDGYRSQTYMEAVRFPQEVTLTRLLSSNPIFVSALCPTAIVEEVGCFALDLVGTEDYDLWLKIVERGYRVVANRQPLAVYRLTPGSVSTDINRGTAALERTYRRALERGRLTRRQRRIARRSVRFWRALREVNAIREQRRLGDLRWKRVLCAMPLFVVVKLEHPEQWLDAFRHAIGRPATNAALDRPRNADRQT